MRRAKRQVAKREIVAGLRSGATWQDAVWGTTIDMGTVQAAKWRVKDPEFDTACWDAAVTYDAEWRAEHPEESDERDNKYRARDYQSTAQFRTLFGTMSAEDAAQWAQSYPPVSEEPLNDYERNFLLSQRLGLKMPLSAK
ncbi:MAG: hypothetical protein F4091_11025 [Acidimicrobiales bacterium]|nr:hypothetical protein [Acidimicrobiales bacterium]MYD83449.1 hypothetical protein [Acidimicrobiales bacterium]MYJ65980.1 hypothetical protein [Acidimicrobiales bacterium]